MAVPPCASVDAYAERREAQEVFTTINRYTQTVSAIVEKSGGSVVEFNGDGMMAVFGAPTPLPHKERAVLSLVQLVEEEGSEQRRSGQPSGRPPAPKGISRGPRPKLLSAGV